MLIFFSSLFLIFFLIYMLFSKKLLVLLLYESLTLLMIFFFSTGYLNNGSFSFSISLIFLIMMVLDSVFGLSVLVSSTRNSFDFSFFFSSF